MCASHAVPPAWRLGDVHAVLRFFKKGNTDKCEINIPDFCYSALSTRTCGNLLLWLTYFFICKKFYYPITVGLLSLMQSGAKYSHQIKWKWTKISSTHHYNNMLIIQHDMFCVLHYFSSFIHVNVLGCLSASVHLTTGRQILNMQLSNL